jgi:uncharacterized protein YndB with AHSA1/START domain
MSTISQKVTIRATPQQVREALVRPEEYRGWWSKNCAIADWIGGESLLHFLKEGTHVSMRFRVDELAASRVQWTCVAHDFEPWVGTTLSWTIQPAEGAAEVSLAHEGWKGEPPPPVAEGWQHFLGSLKSYVETGVGQPW